MPDITPLAATPSGLRPFDHFVAVVKDLYLAERAYTRLGFRTTPMVHHDVLGTSNSVIQFRNAYFELLGDIDHVIEEGIVKQLLTERVHKREGLMMASFLSKSLESDRAEFERLGLMVGPLQDARRNIRLAAGGWGQTDSRTIGIIDVERPGHAVIVSRHNKPDRIWMPEWMVHPNTADCIVGLVYVAPSPRALADFFAPILGGAPTLLAEDEVRFITSANETLTILSPSALALRYGADEGAWNPDVAVYPVGLEVNVRDLDSCRWALRDGGVRFFEDRQMLTTGRAFGLGVIFTFVASC